MNVQAIKNLEDLKKSIDSGEVDTFSKAIRLKCLDCCAYEHAEVKRCTVESCPLWRFRSGHRASKRPQETRNDVVNSRVGASL